MCNRENFIPRIFAHQETWIRLQNVKLFCIRAEPASSKSGEYSENISWLLPLLSNSTFFHMLRRKSEIWMVLILLCGWHIRWGTFMISFDVLIRFGCLLDRLSAEQLKRGRKGSRSLNWNKWENWFGSPRGKLKDST